MPSPTAHIFKNYEFDYKGKKYTVIASIEPDNPSKVNVQAFDSGHPVVVTYPDKLKATLLYTVDLMTRIDFERATGFSAVDELIKTAESDVKQWL